MSKAKKVLFFLLAMVLICSTLTVGVLADGYFSGGSGTVGDPYLISTTADLLDLSNKTNSSDRTLVGQLATCYYKLTNDIDMTGIGGYKGLFCLDPITVNQLTEGYALTGTFDGDGHVIKNLTIEAGDSTNARGFISMSYGATVKNLGIENIAIYGGAQVGGIIGQVRGGTATIENCYVRGASFSPKSGWQGQAGICGGTYNNDADNTVIIKNCYVNANLGICGHSTGVEVHEVRALMENCYTVNSSFIYSHGFATGFGVTNCYANATAATVTAAKLGSAYKDNPLPELLGGLPVLVWENVVAPKTDFSGGSGAPDDPYLISTAADLLELSGKTNSKDTIAEFSTCCYKMTDDIDMTGMSGFQGLNCFEIANPNSNTWFTGTFDGNGHIVKNLTIAAGASTRPRGFISEAGANAKVRNLGIENITITGGAQLGGIVGQARGTGAKIENCFVRGASFSPADTWQGEAAICGGVAANTDMANIENCYAIGTGKGFCGYNIGQPDQYHMFATLKNCYSDGALSGSSVTNCYANANDLSVSAEMLGSAFIKNNSTTYHDGLPVLAWEESRLLETVLPTVTKRSCESELSYLAEDGVVHRKKQASEDATDFYSMRFIFNVTGEEPARNCGAYIIPFDVFSGSGKTKTVTVTHQPTAAVTSFAADLLQIPYAARDRIIYVVPFVNDVAEISQSFKVSAAAVPTK